MTALNKQALREAAQEEIMLRSAGDTSDAWQDEASPEAVLALLDELEAAQKQATQQGNIAVELFDEVTRLQRSADDKAPELREQLEAAEKRIAELEGNEIREEGNQFLVVRHPGKAPVIKHWSGDPEEFLRNLIEQDPLVTIDIITHRYYGVGGQWVQDADEYLYMMTAAGIGVKGE